MAKVKVKVVHLITMGSSICKAACDIHLFVEPIDKNIIMHTTYNYMPFGTFDPGKVTCKRCLKSGDYKTAIDRLKYPLFFLGK